MGTWQEYFKGAYITALEFKGKQPTLTVTKVEGVDVANPDTGEIKQKLVLRWKEVERGMIVNRSNACAIAAMFGDETSAWVGKRLSLRAEEVQVGPKRELGIRVYGSPDIQSPVTATVVLPRKKPRQVILQPTGKGAKPAQEPDNERNPGQEG